MSNLCRYTGHTRSFLNVAQHSVLVYELVEPPHRPWALLHHAAEAYLRDMAGTLKSAAPSLLPPRKTPCPLDRLERVDLALDPHQALDLAEGRRILTLKQGQLGARDELLEELEIRAWASARGRSRVASLSRWRRGIRDSRCSAKYPLHAAAESRMAEDGLRDFALARASRGELDDALPFLST